MDTTICDMDNPAYNVETPVYDIYSSATVTPVYNIDSAYNTGILYTTRTSRYITWTPLYVVTCALLYITREPLCII